MPAKLILASGSPQRKKILSALGVAFTAIPSDISESHDGLRRPHAVARHIALKKARHIARKNPENWVLGVDTLVVLKNGRISGKPKNIAEAKTILKSYSNAHGDVISGVALMHYGKKKIFVGHEKTRVYFREFSKREMNEYLKNEPRWRASSGAMTIEGVGGRWVRRMEGDYWNVVGLPVKTLKSMLARAMGL